MIDGELSQREMAGIAANMQLTQEQLYTIAERIVYKQRRLIILLAVANLGSLGAFLWSVIGLPDRVTDRLVTEAAARVERDSQLLTTVWQEETSKMHEDDMAAAALEIKATSLKARFDELQHLSPPDSAAAMTLIEEIHNHQDAGTILEQFDKDKQEILTKLNSRNVLTYEPWSISGANWGRQVGNSDAAYCPPNTVVVGVELNEGSRPDKEETFAPLCAPLRWQGDTSSLALSWSNYPTGWTRY